MSKVVFDNKVFDFDFKSNKTILSECNRNETDLSNNEVQYDDVKEEGFDKMEELLDYWKNIEQFEQKSRMWLQQRSMFIGGSESGAALGYDEYKQPYRMILGKLTDVPFGSFIHVYHGNKYEDVATMIYEWMNNVKVDQYGFLPHRSIDFIGASPDGITSCYKYDGIHISNKHGTMVEIKCPTSRKINMISNEMFDVIPKHYYCQVQQQMETCDLEYTDFWQCNIQEYRNFDEFQRNYDKPAFNKKGQFIGAVIQILPRESFKDYTTAQLTMPSRKIKELIYARAKFIYQPKLMMTLEEIKKWIMDVKLRRVDCVNDFLKEHYNIREGWFFHSVKYWFCMNARNIRIKRNREFFNSHLPFYKEIWGDVCYFRNNEEDKNKFIKICNGIENAIKENGLTYKFKEKAVFEEEVNKEMMDVIEKLKNKQDISETWNKYITEYDEELIDSPVQVGRFTIE